MSSWVGCHTCVIPSVLIAKVRNGQEAGKGVQARDLDGDSSDGGSCGCDGRPGDGGGGGREKLVAIFQPFKTDRKIAPFQPADDPGTTSSRAARHGVAFLGF